MRLTLFSLPLSLIAGMAWSCATFADQQQQEQQQPQRPDLSALHWTQRLGIRSAEVLLSAKVVDRVVLVPDTATYLDELSKWTPSGRWPVLIEDEALTPMFVRRFKPAQLLRRASIGTPLPADVNTRQVMAEKIVVAAIGGNPDTHTITQLFDAANYRPPGVVVASMADPAWTAAVALAAGRAQPLIWIDDDYGTVDGVLDDARARQLADRIGAAVDGLLYNSRELGDAIDVITLCRNLSVAAAVKLPDSQRDVKEGQYADGPVALSDFIGRNIDGRRYAFTGWIFGDEVRCAYMAMCSLFLSRESASLFNSYANDGEFGLYKMDEAAQKLDQAGFAVQLSTGETEMSPAAWARMIAGGVSSDLVWMNSGGNADFFILNGGNARPGDVPVLNQPAALHLIHSWSLRSPSQSNTVGGRWLDHGVYAMVGSCHEPFLAAFHRPTTLALRCLGGAPMLIAARRWIEDGFANPWRVVTIGDPLLIVPPPGGIRIERINQPQADGDNLHVRVREVMKIADAQSDIGSFVEAIRLLDMMGQDQVAVQMWQLSKQKGLHSGRIGSAILPAMFRVRDADGFLEAWNEGGPRLPVHFDMLWHLMGPRLAGTVDRQLLITLESAIRTDAPAHDVERLAPALARVFGRDRVGQLIQREISRSTNTEQQRQLRELAGRL